MPCNGCGRKGSMQVNLTETGTPIECEYDSSTLQSWLLTFYTIKQNNQVITLGLTYPKINSYIGYTQSALNTPLNPCFFKTQLDEIAAFINNL